VAEIRRARAAHALRLMDDADARVSRPCSRIQQAFERAPVRMLGLVAVVLPKGV